jgi:phosphatidylinositol 4-kinase B
LLDADGHIVHIDFGYLLTVAPGGVQFERSPFKLTSEFADVLGGPTSKLFRRFRGLCVQAFVAARKRRDQLLVLVEMMLASNSSLPCFAKGPKAVLTELNDRFLPGASKRQCEVFVNGLIDACVPCCVLLLACVVQRLTKPCTVCACVAHRALSSWTTVMYDKYQKCCVGIF